MSENLAEVDVLPRLRVAQAAIAAIWWLWNLEVVVALTSRLPNGRRVFLVAGGDRIRRLNFL
jgi:hypothetical protein